MTPALISKLPELQDSIFSRMSQLAHSEEAVNLSQGFPDFGADPELIRACQKALQGNYNQYAPLAGIFSLREAIAQKTESLHQAVYDPGDEITVTNGATQAIFTAIAASIRPGDEVIVFKPAYDCYEPSVRAQGGKPVPLQLRPPGFRIDWDALEAAIGPDTRMIILNSPHNPSGTVLKQEELVRLERMLDATDILVLSDEVYEHLVFDGAAHQSVCRFEGLKERSFICASFGKTFHVTGWKLGYCLAPRELMKEFRKLHEFIVFSVHHPTQRAVASYLQEPARYTGLGSFFQEKRDRFLSGLEGSRFQWVPSEGTYFQLLDYSALSKEGDIAFAERLTREQKVASIPISVFNVDGEDPKMLRFCFAKEAQTLDAATAILREL